MTSVKLKYHHSLGVKTDVLEFLLRKGIKPKKSVLFCFSMDVISLFLSRNTYMCRAWICDCGVAPVRQKCTEIVFISNWFIMIVICFFIQ